MPQISIFEFMIYFGIPFLFGGLAWFATGFIPFAFTIGFLIGAIGLASMEFKNSKLFQIFGVLLGGVCGIILSVNFDLDIPKMTASICGGGIFGYILARWGDKIADGVSKGL